MDPFAKPPSHITKTNENLSSLAGFPQLQTPQSLTRLVEPEEEKALGRPYSSLPVPKGDLQEIWRWTFYKGMW